MPSHFHYKKSIINKWQLSQQRKLFHRFIPRYADCNKLDSFHIWCQRRILHISWHDFVSNDEVLHHTGLFNVWYIVSKRRLGLFGHVARLRSDVPTKQILQICTKTRDGERPSQECRRACGQPSTTWTHQICRDTGVTATEALQLAKDRPFWRTIATEEAPAECFVSR